MDPIADQMLAAMEEASGYSELAASFHPDLRARVSALVSGARTMPDALPDLALYAVARELSIRAATEGQAPYIVWARYPQHNWPVPACMSIPRLARLLVLQSADRCDWCERTGPAPSALLASAGSAVALFAFCAFCRLALADECDADLSWIDVS